MKQFVRDHFEDFANKWDAAVIYKNITADFYDLLDPAQNPLPWTVMST